MNEDNVGIQEGYQICLMRRIEQRRAGGFISFVGRSTPSILQSEQLLLASVYGGSVPQCFCSLSREEPLTG